MLLAASWHSLALAESESEGSLCYSPTRNNVSYSELLETEVDAPSALIAYGEDSLQYGELWLPAAKPQKAPLVIFVHGGCWLSAYDIQHSHALSTGLSRSGYAVWSLEYRRTGNEGGGWPGSLNDVSAGITFALSQLARTNDAAQIDFDDVRLLGHSAGGHLALLAAADPAIRGTLSQVIGLAAITDPTSYGQGNNSCQQATESFMGGSLKQRTSEYRAASLVNKTLPDNTLLLIGGKDVIVGADQSDALPAKTITIDDAGHFDFIDPHSFAFNQLLQQLGKGNND